MTMFGAGSGSLPANNEKPRLPAGRVKFQLGNKSRSYWNLGPPARRVGSQVLAGCDPAGEGFAVLGLAGIGRVDEVRVDERASRGGCRARRSEQPNP